MAGAGAAVVEAFDHVWGRLGDRLLGLTDEEYRWEPVAGCLSIRSGSDGRVRADEAPQVTSGAAPFTTIAWRLAHLAGETVSGFTLRLFPGTAATVPDPPAGADQVPEYLAASYRPWRAGLVSLTDVAWFVPLGPAWAPYADATVLDVALHVFDEVVHHSAEVALLRDLFARRPH
jgi:hypothetical protein